MFCPLGKVELGICFVQGEGEKDSGPVHMRTNHVPKDVSKRDSALSWFESLILALVNAKLFQIRLLKHV